MFWSGMKIDCFDKDRRERTLWYPKSISFRPIDLLLESVVVVVKNCSWIDYMKLCVHTRNNALRQKKGSEWKTLKRILTHNSMIQSKTGLYTQATSRKINIKKKVGDQKSKQHDILLTLYVEMSWKFFLLYSKHISMELESKFVPCKRQYFPICKKGLQVKSYFFFLIAFLWNSLEWFTPHCAH